jgi:hypothetical protein
MKTASSILCASLLLAGAAHAEPRDEVIAAFDAALAKQTYHVTMTSEVRGKPFETHTAVKLPASFHMKNPESETIVLPSGSWMRTGDDWMRLPMDMSRMVKNITFQAMKDGEQYVQDVQATGEETIDGCASKNYRYRTEGKVMGFKAKSTVDLSVCQHTGLPIRLISTDAKGKNSTQLRYDFVTPVEIHAPG